MEFQVNFIFRCLFLISEFYSLYIYFFSVFITDVLFSMFSLSSFLTNSGVFCLLFGFFGGFFFGGMVTFFSLVLLNSWTKR